MFQLLADAGESVLICVDRLRGSKRQEGVNLLKILLGDLERIVAGENADLDDVRKILEKDIALYNQFKQGLSLNPRRITPEAEQPSDAYLLKSLRAAIMSLDWRADKEQLEEYDRAMVMLRRRYGGSAIHALLLDAMEALSRYMWAKIPTVQAGTSSLLNVLANAFALLENPEPSLEEKKSVLAKAIEEYEAFRHRFVFSAAAPTKKIPTEEPVSAASQGPLMGQAPSEAEVIAALDAAGDASVDEEPLELLLDMEAEADADAPSPDEAGSLFAGQGDEDDTEAAAQFLAGLGEIESTDDEAEELILDAMDVVAVEEGEPPFGAELRMDELSAPEENGVDLLMDDRLEEAAEEILLDNAEPAVDEGLAAEGISVQEVALEPAQVESVMEELPPDQDDFSTEEVLLDADLVTAEEFVDVIFLKEDETHLESKLEAGVARETSESELEAGAKEAVPHPGAFFDIHEEERPDAEPAPEEAPGEEEAVEIAVAGESEFAFGSFFDTDEQEGPLSLAAMEEPPEEEEIVEPAVAEESEPAPESFFDTDEQEGPLSLAAIMEEPPEEEEIVEPAVAEESEPAPFFDAEEQDSVSRAAMEEHLPETANIAAEESLQGEAGIGKPEYPEDIANEEILEPVIPTEATGKEEGSLLTKILRDSGYLQDKELEAEQRDPRLLENLEICIESLNTELGDSILCSLRDELDRIGKQLERRFVPRQLLHLLAATVQHVDRFREKARPDSMERMRSLFQALRETLHLETNQAEQLNLLGREIASHLQWQQRIIDQLLQQQESGASIMPDYDGLRNLVRLEIRSLCNELLHAIKNSGR